MVEQSSLEIARLLANSGAELDRSYRLSRSALSRTLHSKQRRSIDLSALSGTILTPWFRTATSRPLRCHECPKSISLTVTSQLLASANGNLNITRSLIPSLEAQTQRWNLRSRKSTFQDMKHTCIVRSYTQRFYLQFLHSPADMTAYYI